MPEATSLLQAPPGGADPGLGEEARHLLHAVRLGRLLDLLGTGVDRATPTAVLVAGCGTGELARALDRCGFDVEGVDPDPLAIEAAREQGGRVRYSLSSLSAWRSPRLFDAVCAEDAPVPLRAGTGGEAEWEAGLRNLASLVRLGGRLVVPDEDPRALTLPGGGAAQHPPGALAAVLEPLGLTPRGFTPYAFRDSRVGFATFTRTR